VRSAELPRLIAALKGPMNAFVRDSRVRISLVVSHSGQVLAQHGFTSSYEVMNVASLAAATHASSRALAEVTHSGAWRHLYRAGKEKQLFLAPLATPVAPLILVAIFDHDSSLGLVQMFFQRLADDVTVLPELQEAPAATDPLNFERDLEAGLDRIFLPEPDGGG
jgi:predicted regulator of Ras-like GTPase activity (Roadblock/LC7/MglB family)